MAGSRVPGSTNQGPIDAGTSILSFSPVQGPTGGVHDAHRPDGARYQAVAQTQTKDGSSPGATALPGTGISLQFTIDDAPYVSATNDAMLDLLDKYQIKTMFFVEGMFVQARPKDLLKIVQRGQQIGLHTWDHPDLTKLTSEKIKEEFIKTDTEVKRLTGKSMAPHWRPPYGAGAFDRRVLGVAASVGFTKMWYWDIDTRDWDTKAGAKGHRTDMSQADITKKITDIVENQLAAWGKTHTGIGGQKGKYIVLCHDKPTTVKALEVLLPRLKSEGYTLANFP